MIHPLMYWIDFGLSIMTAWGIFWLALRTPVNASGWKIFWTLLSTLPFFRALIFIHEIVHIRKVELRGFPLAWNTFCGMFFLLPDYTYISHLAHHLIPSFSTMDDPEYVPLAFQRPIQLFAPLLLFPLVPFVMAMRFLIAGPLSIAVGGRCREWLLRHASSLKMNPKFEWKNISPEDRRLSVIEDLACVAWWSAFLTLAYATVGLGPMLLEWYLVTYALLVMNHVRSFLQHRYINNTGEKVSYEEQLLDSITITGFSPLADVLCPVGLRYHSLHHMFPTLPYHALPEAHDRLVKELPADHIYMKTLAPGLWAAIVNFRKTAQQVQIRSAAPVV